MKYTHIFIIALAFIAFSDSSAFAQSKGHDAVEPADQTKTESPKADKQPSGKTSKNKSKGKPPASTSEQGETIIFPKVSKVGKSSDDWETNTGRRGSGNRQTFR